MCLYESKYVCVMADYYSTGIWDANGAPVELRYLPVSDEIKNLLQHMIYDYDRTDDESDHTTEILFSARSYEIAKLIKAELKSWTVTFFNFDGHIPLKTKFHKSEVL